MPSTPGRSTPIAKPKKGFFSKKRLTLAALILATTGIVAKDSNKDHNYFPRVADYLSNFDDGIGNIKEHLSLMLSSGSSTEPDPKEPESEWETPTYKQPLFLAGTLDDGSQIFVHDRLVWYTTTKDGKFLVNDVKILEENKLGASLGIPAHGERARPIERDDLELILEIVGEGYRAKLDAVESDIPPSPRDIRREKARRIATSYISSEEFDNKVVDGLRETLDVIATNGLSTTSPTNQVAGKHLNEFNVEKEKRAGIDTYRITGTYNTTEGMPGQVRFELIAEETNSSVVMKNVHIEREYQAKPKKGTKANAPNKPKPIVQVLANFDPSTWGDLIANSNGDPTKDIPQVDFNGIATEIVKAHKADQRNEYVAPIINGISNAIIIEDLGRNQLEATLTPEKGNSIYVATIDLGSNSVVSAYVKDKQDKVIHTIEVGQEDGLAKAVLDTYKSRVANSVDSLIGSIGDAKSKDISIATLAGRRLITADWNSTDRKYHARVVVEFDAETPESLEIQNLSETDEENKPIKYTLAAEQRSVLIEAVQKEFFARKREEFKEFGKRGRTQYRSGE